MALSFNACFLSKSLPAMDFTPELLQVPSESGCNSVIEDIYSSFDVIQFRDDPAPWCNLLHDAPRPPPPCPSWRLPMHVRVSILEFLFFATRSEEFALRISTVQILGKFDHPRVVRSDSFRKLLERIQPRFNNKWTGECNASTGG